MSPNSTKGQKSVKGRQRLVILLLTM